MYMCSLQTCGNIVAPDDIQEYFDEVYDLDVDVSKEEFLWCIHFATYLVCESLQSCYRLQRSKKMFNGKTSPTGLSVS